MAEIGADLIPPIINLIFMEREGFVRALDSILEKEMVDLTLTVRNLGGVKSGRLRRGEERSETGKKKLGKRYA